MNFAGPTKYKSATVNRPYQNQPSARPANAATKNATAGPTVNRKNQPIFGQAANKRFKPRIKAPITGSFMYSSSPVSQ